MSSVRSAVWDPPFQVQIRYAQPSGNGTAALPLVCRQLISRGLNLVDSIAAFQIVRGDYSYYSASTGWFDKDWTWHPEYGVDYGTPLGPAQRRPGPIYVRNFTKSSVVVNCTGAGSRGNCKGAIAMK